MRCISSKYCSQLFPELRNPWTALLNVYNATAHHTDLPLLGKYAHIYKESPAFGIWQDVHILAEGKTGSPCHMSYVIYYIQTITGSDCMFNLSPTSAHWYRVLKSCEPPTPTLAPFIIVIIIRRWHRSHLYYSVQGDYIIQRRWLLGARSLPPELLGKVATLIIYPRNLFHLGNNSIDISRNI